MSADSEAPQQQAAFKVDAVIEKYLELRDKKDTINARVEAEVAAIDAQMKILNGWLHQQMHLIGTDSFKTDRGTAFLKTSDFCSVADFNVVIQHVIEHSAWHMLTKGVNKTAVQEFIKEHGNPPPGVNYGTKEEVQVRRK